MTEKIRFGIIGAGAIAQAHAQAISLCDTAALTSVVDLREDAARALAESFSCKTHPTYQSLRASGEVDAVILCTPPASHAGIAQVFLECGVAVLCEKPLCLDSATATHLVDTARKHEVAFTMASKFRFVDDIVRAKSILASGILGEVLVFENAFAARVDMRKRWNSDPKVSGGGVLIDNGTHSVDIVRYFLGPIAEVQAVEGKRVQQLEVEDTVQLFVRSASGVICSIDLSWSLNKELESFINVYGSQGTLHIGWKESKYRQSGSKDWVVFGRGYDKVQAFQNQIQNFCAALRGAEPLRIGPEDAIASVRVIEAAYRSLQANNWIRVGV